MWRCKPLSRATATSIMHSIISDGWLSSGAASACQRDTDIGDECLDIDANPSILPQLVPSTDRMGEHCPHKCCGRQRCASFRFPTPQSHVHGMQVSDCHRACMRLWQLKKSFFQSLVDGLYPVLIVTTVSTPSTTMTIHIHQALPPSNHRLAMEAAEESAAAPALSFMPEEILMKILPELDPRRCDGDWC